MNQPAKMKNGENGGNGEMKNNGMKIMAWRRKRRKSSEKSAWHENENNESESNISEASVAKWHGEEMA
jgi:uncharacterized lipoprotein YddW (UPF0748 family)